MRNSLAYGLVRSPVWNWMHDFEDFFDRAVTDSRHDGRNAFPYSVNESKDGYLLNIDLPGVSKEDLKVEIADGFISLSGERKRGDFGVSKFSHRFSIPRDAEVTKMEANLENGVLLVAVPKAESAKARTIEIQSGEKSGLFSRLLSGASEN